VTGRSGQRKGLLHRSPGRAEDKARTVGAHRNPRSGQNPRAVPGSFGQAMMARLAWALGAHWGFCSGEPWATAGKMGRATQAGRGRLLLSIFQQGFLIIKCFPNCKI
jgi:hypothetical protein